MKILFASAMPYLSQAVGGLNTNTHQLALELSRRGHNPSVLARLSYGNLYGARRFVSGILAGERISSSPSHGYPVYCTRRPWEAFGQVPRCDVAVIQDGSMLRMAKACKAAGIPSVMYFHGLEFESWMVDGRPAKTSDLTDVGGFIANSEFTASRFLQRYGLSAKVVRPVFKSQRYRIDRNGQSVTFINPISEKGVDVALNIARLCPDIPFEFIKAWPLSLGNWLSLKLKVGNLPNVSLLGRVADMREIYRRTRILLVPSQWEAETWGRVVSEAHVSGIPVVASDKGGLPESVGEGGEIVPATAPVEKWVGAIRRLWDDPDYYANKSNAALEHSRLPSLDEGAQVSGFLEAIESYSQVAAPR